MSSDQEWRRLQGLYAALSDGELLRLAGDKDGLTEVAQQAIDAEMSTRGLEVPVQEAAQSGVPELHMAEGDSPLVPLLTAYSAADANQAASCLETAEIPFQLRPEKVRETEGGPWIYSGGLEVVVEADRWDDAVQIVRKGTKFLAVAEVEVDEHQEDAGDSEEEELLQVGDFESEEDGEFASQALRNAGIRFKVERIAVDSEGRTIGPLTKCTFIAVRFEDMQRAVEVVKAAFGDAER